MIPQQAHTHIAIPMALPGCGSTFGIFLERNSFPRESDNPDTTMNCQTRFSNGTSMSQTIPGAIVLDAMEHLASALEREAMKTMYNTKMARNIIPATT